MIYIACMWFGFSSTYTVIFFFFFVKLQNRKIEKCIKEQNSAVNLFQKLTALFVSFWYCFVFCSVILHFKDIFKSACEVINIV